MMLGAWELVVVAVAALLVLGPEKLPELARTLAKLTSQAQNIVAEVRRQVDAALHQQESQTPPRPSHQDPQPPAEGDAGSESETNAATCAPDVPPPPEPQAPHGTQSSPMATRPTTRKPPEP